MNLKQAADLSNEAHQYRNLMEDYNWMIDGGESHDNACKRLDVSPETFLLLQKAHERKESRR